MSDDFFSGSTGKPQRRKRHPIRAIIVTLVVLAVLLIPGYFVAEGLAETAAKGYVQTGVQKELNVPALDDIHVNLGKGSIILQALQKKITHLDVLIDRFSTDSITGSAVFTASGVPLNTSDPVDTMDIAVTLDPASLQALVRATPGLAGATVTLVGGNVRIALTEKLLSVKIPVSIDLAPSVANGKLVFTPVAITVVKQKFTVKSLKASPFGSLLSGLVKPRTQCVASSLPKDLVLTKIQSSGERLVLTVAGTGVSLSGLSTKGSCTAS
jgi:hypothetical protein